jgi:Domain of unknown function (DUF222)
VSELLSVIDATAAVDSHSLGAPGLIVALEELIQARDRLDALLAARLQAADVIQATVDECGRCTRGWLVEEMRRSPHEARRMLTVARAMPAYPSLAAAFGVGDVSAEQVRVILGCLRQLSPEAVPAATEILLEAARSMDPVTLGQVAREIQLRAGADESREAAAQRRYDSRWARVSATFQGMVHLKAMLDPEAGRTLLTAIEAIMSAPHHHEGPPRPDTGTGADPDPGAGADDCAGPGSWGGCVADVRTVAQRRADALVDLARRSLSGGDLPDHGGDRPQVMVTIDYAALTGALTDPTQAAGTLTGPLGPVPISPDTARRLACDADLIPAVLATDSTILDLGRSQRAWSAAQRRAARLRDHGCVFPRCQASLDQCDLHHLQHWARGGPTNHDNSAHLCHFHHWLVHHRNWEIWRDKPTQRIRVRRT